MLKFAIVHFLEPASFSQSHIKDIQFFLSTSREKSPRPNLSCARWCSELKYMRTSCTTDFRLVLDSSIRFHAAHPFNYPLKCFSNTNRTRKIGATASRAKFETGKMDILDVGDWKN